MGKDTKISWTRSASGHPGSTFNPWWGCLKVSEECLHCYADTFATRYGHRIFGNNPRRIFTTDKHWNEPLAWNTAARAAGERRKVFCMSMGDLFEDRPELAAPRARVFDLIRRTDWLDWLLCTKRPERLQDMLPVGWNDHPYSNVWLLATAGTGARFTERWGHLSKISAVVRGISAEPLLGSLMPALRAMARAKDPVPDWIIVGGESGFPARPIGNADGDPNVEDDCNIQAAGEILGACQALGIAYYFKQTGSVFARHAHFKDRRAGADPSEWPADMRVQEFPTRRAVKGAR